MHATIMAAVLSMAANGGSVQNLLAQKFWAEKLLDQAQLAESATPPQNLRTPPQSPQPPVTDGRAAVPQAPIGHRQPTQRDVGAGGLRRSVEPSERSLINDSYLPPSICRGC
jgi:hypothetical protein